MTRRDARATALATARATAIATALALVVTACGSPAPTPPPATPAPIPTVAPQPTPTPRPASQPSVVVGARFQSGPFVLTIGEVVHDTTSGAVFLATRFENLGSSWASPLAQGSLEIAGQTFSVVNQDALASIPPGMASDVMLQVPLYGAQGLDPLGDGVLRWGRPDETETTVRLADGHVDGFGLPREVAVDAWGQIGREAIHITLATLFADALGAPRASTGEHVLRLVFDEYGTSPSVVNGFVPADQVTLRRPDGITEDALRGSVGRPALSWTSSTDNHVDFAVPADPAGDYEALLASVSRTALGTFHTDLIQRVPVAFTIPPLTDADAVAAQRLAAEDPVVRRSLPRAALPPEVDAAAGIVRPTPHPIDLALATDPVGLPGQVFRATRLRWDPATAIATVEGEATLVDPIVPPDDGILSAPSAFLPTVAIEYGGRLYGGSIATTVPYLEPGTWAPVAFAFPFVPALHGDDVTMVLGLDGMAPSTLPLNAAADASLAPPSPAPPTFLPAEAPPVTAGNYTVQVTGYRFGLVRESDRPPAGMRALEVVADVTAHQVESPGAFGLLFAGPTQLFLTGTDGYLQQASTADTAYLEDGMTATIGATFLVPETWTPGTMGLTIRSIDEIRAITRTEWVEVDFAVTFGGDS